MHEKSQGDYRESRHRYALASVHQREQEARRGNGVARDRDRSHVGVAGLPQLRHDWSDLTARGIVVPGATAKKHMDEPNAVPWKRMVPP